MKYVKVEIVTGVEGVCLLVNGTRIAGPKPWAGGKIICTWVVLRDEMRDAIAKQKCIEAGEPIEAVDKSIRGEI